MGKNVGRHDLNHTYRPSMRNHDRWIFAAGALALVFSIFLWFRGDKQAAIFVGLWVPTLWILADYLKE